MTKRKLAVITAVLLIIVCAVCAAACKKKTDEKQTTVKKKAPEPVINPLTGSDKFKRKTMKNQRICGFVVENHPDARPQVGMDDEKYSPDIILEGEVEGGISRMFWLYADYKKLPETIGPLRSARPPYIRFANMFDAYFIHWGMSHTQGGYTGANTVFKKTKTDHINAMTFSNECNAFGRDMSTGKSLEHTGRAYGKQIPKALKEAGFRSKPKPYTRLKFRKENGPMGKKTCGEVTVTFSSVSGSTHWTYDKESETYKSDSFQNNVERDNIIVLSDKTEYITNALYQGHGVTYCDYLFKGGKAWIISKGTYIKARWKRKNGKLFIYTREEKKVPKTEEEKKAEADENSAKDEMEDPDYKIEIVEKEFELNTGKSWIGWISANHGGKVDITKLPEDEPEDTRQDA